MTARRGITAAKPDILPPWIHVTRAEHITDKPPLYVCLWCFGLLDRQNARNAKVIWCDDTKRDRLAWWLREHRRCGPLLASI